MNAKELRRRANVKAKDMETSVQAILMQALQDWTDGPRTTNEDATQQLQMLHEILDHGTAADKNSIRMAIRECHQRLPEAADSETRKKFARK